MLTSRVRRVLPIAAALTGVVLLTSACAPDAPKPTPTPTHTAIFASEDDALQAAIDVYQQYSAAYDAYLAGNTNRAALKKFMTSEYWATYSTEPPLSDSGLHIEGSTRFYNTSLVQTGTESGTTEIKIAFCDDASQVRILDEEGKDVTPKDRPDRVPTFAEMKWDVETGVLQISKVGSWDDSDICS